MSPSTIGAVLLALSCAGTGIFLGEREKKKAVDLRMYLSLCEHLYREIVYRRSGLSNCFLSFKETQSSKETEEKMILFSRGNYKKALDDSLLQDDIRKELFYFFSQLGTGNIRQEEQKIKEITAYLKEKSKSQKEQTDNAVKVYKTLGCCIGAVLLLLLI